jgi:tRNA 2-thiouridine synthesizing protein A
MSNHNSVPALLDATGLSCPLPVLRTRKALAGLAAGALLEVRATDPAAVKDMAAFCEATGHELVESSATEGIYRFLLRKAG